MAKSLALRLMIHYVGDLHQPLHCLSRVNPEFKAGDRGGNMFPLASHVGIKELHALWDKVLYEYPKSYKFPLTDDEWARVGADAGKFAQ